MSSKGWKDWLTFVGEILPVVGDFIKWIAGMSDKEWESISKVWPEPTKTQMAKMRAEAKARLHFFGED